MSTSILVVEDNPDVRHNLHLTLELNKYGVIEAQNGQKALEILKKMGTPPDLILSDIMMPEMDGYNFLQTVSENESWKWIPFIFLTAKDASQDIQLAKTLGADDYIVKPFQEEDLLSRIADKLTNHTTLRDNFEKELDTKLQGMEIPKSTFQKEPLFFYSMMWDPEKGPIIEQLIPPSKDNTEIETVGLHIFYAALNNFVRKKMPKASTVHFQLPMLNEDCFVLMDSRPLKSNKAKMQRFVLAVVAPYISYFNGIKIKSVFTRIADRIKAYKKWSAKHYHNRLKKLVNTQIKL